MAKKVDKLTLEEIRRNVKLYKSFHNTSVANIEIIAKELGVKKLDLWEFILKNESYFVITSAKEYSTDTNIKWRFIKEVLDTPKTEDK